MDSSPWVIFLCLLSLYPSPGLGQIPTNEHLITASVAPMEANIDTLEYVQVIWRHGDRSPAAVFDPQEEKLWPEGLGELTKTGMGQHYRLGKWLRQRYGKFLNEHFDRQEVYVRSSDFNRTLMSALANMAGLFPPQQKEVWDQELLWQPVPVHSVPKLQDKQLYEDIPCPLAEIENQIIYGSSVVKDIEKENADFLKFLADRTNSSNSGLGAMWRVYDSLNCQFYHNKTHHWPVWVNQSVFEQVVRLYDIGSRLKFHTEFLRRIRGGPLVEEMYHRFLDKSKGRLGSRAKLYAYSAHDTTLAAFLATLDIYPERFPLYATAVIVELHRVDGQPVVELYRKNITDSPILYRTEIPGCGASCTLDGLHSIMSKYFPQNWEGECGYKQETLTPYIVAIVILSTTTAIFGGILIFDIILKRRARPIGDSSLQSEPLINEADT